MNLSDNTIATPVNPSTSRLQITISSIYGYIFEFAHSYERKQEFRDRPSWIHKRENNVYYAIHESGQGNQNWCNAPNMIKIRYLFINHLTLNIQWSNNLKINIIQTYYFPTVWGPPLKYIYEIVHPGIQSRLAFSAAITIQERRWISR